MIVFSGLSNRPLAIKLARALQVKLGEIELSRFANAEARVFVNEKVSGDTLAVVVQSLSNPPDEYLIEFVLICDALKRLGVDKIIGVIPWLGYAKQDKVFRPGEPLSVKVIAKIVQSAQLDQVITFDLHNPAIFGFFDLPLLNLSARSLFVDYFRKRNNKNLIVVAPDAGAVKSSTEFAQALNVPVAYIDKQRNLASGEVAVQGISHAVKGKETLILDDIISTGATLIEVGRFLKHQGAAKIYVAVTHHLFVPGVQNKIEKSPIDQLVITDTIAKPSNLRLLKTKVLSCASLLADTLHRFAG